MDDRCEEEEESFLLSAFILVEGCKFGSSLIVVVLVGGNKVGAKSTLVSSLACTLESSVVVVVLDDVLEDLSCFKMPPNGSTSFFKGFKGFFKSNSLVVEETPESKSSLSRDLLEQRLISGWVELSGDTLAEEW